MTLEIHAKIAGAPAARIPADFTHGTTGVTYYHDARLGEYRIRGDELAIMSVPATIDYVAVRLPFGTQAHAFCYLPHMLGLKYHCPPAGVAWSYGPIRFPGAAHGPIMATCGPAGGIALGCLDHDRTVELLASERGLELRFKPKPGERIRLHVDQAGIATPDVAALLDAFMAGWGIVGGTAHPHDETDALIIGLGSQDVPDDQLLAVAQKLIDDHAGLTDKVVVWGTQDDPQRRCCEPIIPWRPVAAAAIEQFRSQGWTVLPYCRPDGADFAEWLYQHNERGCDSVYVDHVAGCTPAQIAEVDRHTPAGSIIEWPTLATSGFAVLASGCIFGGGPSATWPDGTRRFDSQYLSTWPTMGRRLFPRTKFFLGTQNSYANWWGLPDGSPTEPKRFAHATERWAFRLGMGLIPHPQPYPDGRKWGLNACTNAIMGAWYRTRFWHRRPRWLGVVDDGTDAYVTKFEMRDGKVLRCIDDWENGGTIAITEEP